MKVRIVKDYKDYRRDDLVTVTPNIAHGLIELGVARVDRMYIASDKGYKVKKHGAA